MLAALGQILKSGLSLAFNGAKDAVLGEFGDKLSAEDRLVLDVELRKLEAEATEAITKAAESVLVAEAKSEDPWVRRARPTFLWLMYAVLLYNFIVRPALGQAPMVLDDSLLWLFGAGFLGYTGAREWGKRKI